MRTINIIRPRDANYTPASLLLTYARNNPEAGYKYDEFGKVHLRIRDEFFVYDHWSIKHVGDGLVNITVFLQEEQKGEKS